LWRINAVWFSSERKPTNRIEGRVTASQIPRKLPNLPRRERDTVAT